jgi:outer membrane protein
MKFLKNLSLLLLVIVAASMTATAQKYGYMNSAALLAEMPEVKKADAALQALGKQLEKQGEAKSAAMQAKYEASLKKAQANQLPEAEEKQVTLELQKMQQDLAKFEQTAQKAVADKREALMKPILARVDTAINAVAKEKGYKLVFDTSTGSILYGDPADDITNFVKAKLGVK